MAENSKLPYDCTSPAAIEKFGSQLVGRTLRLARGALAIPVCYLNDLTSGTTRGSFGKVLEQFYFGINPGNESAPDFPLAAVELKSTGLRFNAHDVAAAKERLVLNIINYQKEANAASFETSSLYLKNAVIMLVAYDYASSRAVVDHPIRIARLLRMDELPLADQLIIRNDWKTIHDKIRSGRAHELSEGDTEYLAACTKSATSADRRIQASDGPPAKPRAFAFKAGYMTILLRQMLTLNEDDTDYASAVSSEALRTRSFESEIIARFSPFLGRSIEYIHAQIGTGLNTNSKDYLSRLARRMIGVDGRKILEFEKAEIMMKCIQVNKYGMPKEHMSFPQFAFNQLLIEDWDVPDEDDYSTQAAFRRQVQTKFLFVVFQCAERCDIGDSKVLLKAEFWTMPVSDVEGEVGRVWLAAKNAVRSSNAGAFPKSSESHVAHVRTKAKDGKDQDILPNGVGVTKRCFWLNKEYLRDQLRLNPIR
jgi:DNA mismatch repair protein MutH